MEVTSVMNTGKCKMQQNLWLEGLYTKLAGCEGLVTEGMCESS